MQRIHLTGVVTLDRSMLEAFRKAHGDLDTLEHFANRIGAVGLNIVPTTTDPTIFEASFKNATIKVVKNNNGRPVYTGEKTSLTGLGYSYQTALTALLDSALSPQSCFKELEADEIAMILADDTALGPRLVHIPK